MSNRPWCYAPHKDIVVPPFVEAAKGRYSLGIRQQLWLRYGSKSAENATGILISNATIPHDVWTRAKFCLAPAGNGWGIRIGISAILNCVPLVAQPNVVQGFEDVLPFDAFSRTIGEGDIAALPKASRSASRAGPGQHTLALLYSGHGCLAYNYTLLALCHRAMELHGRLRAGPRASKAKHSPTKDWDTNAVWVDAGRAVTANKLLSLVFVFDGRSVLLGLKKRGFGQLEAGEVMRACAARELREEAGLSVPAAALVRRGVLNFHMLADSGMKGADGTIASRLEVHIYSCSLGDAEGEVAESEEMAPRWWGCDQVPLGQMLPHVLAGGDVIGDFTFADQATLVSHSLDELPPGAMQLDEHR
ncbi:hypothetical protein EMIHUDRAFT_214924 [Emiliania huxleyi CCMP1516]|uniref:Nudix hydrolase domain-containing protein n=2 Tax=Emiliania huxleyi TaxID=2903 RepID=A0A0D3IIM4_EMIH1|nr:hypothetical protein EMIHUDRAFT_214924 [Emiliania huxleyi CCMP1516]EOD11109.1 hypothetical protein EMIHUDRAFT_214924 [Emiliania huxleyi CCMP1516]|eukprot:XP_005763538.1 hypothetical protein EMIHUDRAFT_214924 [Emiliania huxleyi CCMP1516]